MCVCVYTRACVCVYAGAGAGVGAGVGVGSSTEGSLGPLTVGIPRAALIRQGSSDLQARVGAMLFGQREPGLAGLQGQLFAMMSEEIERETSARTPRAVPGVSPAAGTTRTNSFLHCRAWLHDFLVAWPIFTPRQGTGGCMYFAYPVHLPSNVALRMLLVVP